jgi:CBS domain-containing protein
VNSIPVVDAKKKLIGIITREDLLKSLYPDYKDVIDDFSSASDFENMEEKVKDLLTIRAKNLMSRRVIYTRENTPVMRALSRMIVRRVNQLPVLDARSNVVGMVTKGDIFYALFRKHVK